MYLNGISNNPIGKKRGFAPGIVCTLALPYKSKVEAMVVRLLKRLLLSLELPFLTLRVRRSLAASDGCGLH